MIHTASRFRSAFIVFVASAAACLCGSPRTASAAPWSLQEELIARDGAELDQFGFAVAADGNTALVGAPTKTVGANAAQGAVYVMTFDGTRWVKQAELTAGDGAANDDFGTSVALYGNTAIVGAVGKAFGGQRLQGAAYVYGFNGTSWTQQAEIAASDGAPNDSFGASVAVTGNTVLIGAPNKLFGANSSQGAVYTFAYNGTFWLLQTEITPGNGATNETFGRSVAASGNTAIVGASIATVAGRLNQGAAYIYTFNGSSWLRQTEFTPIDGEAGDNFGISVAISGNTAIVGASSKTVGANQSQGAAYIFGSSGASWGQLAEITASDGDSLDLFGYSVAIAGSNVIVGAPSKLVGNQAPGAAYEFTGSGSSWAQQAEFTPTDGDANDSLGGAVAITANSTAVVGAYARTVGSNSYQGATYMFVPGIVEQVPALPGPVVLGLFGLLGLSGVAGGAARRRGRANSATA